jgi:myo-inositol catabolism protein IolC
MGFAVGRTIFWDNLVQFHEQKISREEAVKNIGSEFFKLYQVFVNAQKSA